MQKKQNCRIFTITPWFASQANTHESLPLLIIEKLNDHNEKKR